MNAWMLLISESFLAFIDQCNWQFQSQGKVEEARSGGWIGAIY